MMYQPRTGPSSRLWPLAAIALLAIALSYSNHFQNQFHFDDSHTVEQNVWIRSLANIPKFFTDATTFSTLPANRSWRPLVSTSLAVDYWLGGGLKPLWFHISTFFWFLVQLVLMFVLFRQILRYADESEWADYAALFAAGWYGLHPAMAETVNYVIQRGDLYSTLGVVASMALYAALPGYRKTFLYLIPAAVGMLAKLPAVVFPAMLAGYILLFEKPATRAPMTAIGAALLATGPIAAISAWMTPSTYTPAATSGFDYVTTQPWVALHYFVSFFLPVTLSADSDLSAFTDPLTARALAGYVFLIALLYAIYRTASQKRLRPVCFGLLWFLLGLLPTSLFPLAEVENDHRMFLPFVGLALAATWAVVLALRARPRIPVGAIAGGAAIAMAAYGQGTWQRNKVWHAEESLWRDVVTKSPANGRGLMNYGLALMGRGATVEALGYFERAARYTPNYFVLEINTAIAHGVLGHNPEAEAHFKRAVQLAPNEAQPVYFYGRWLRQKRRAVEAEAMLERAVRLNPAYFDPRYELMATYADAGLAAQARTLATDTLKIAPGDPIALRYQNFAATAAPAPTAEDYLETSLALHQAGQFEEALKAAREALRLRPDYAEAWNNIAAANEGLGRWDDAIAAATQAIRLKPDFQLARNNLAWSLQQKQKAGKTGP
jgi:tetratricopeptide (TPR) repeat protein